MYICMLDSIACHDILTFVVQGDGPASRLKLSQTLSLCTGSPRAQAAHTLGKCLLSMRVIGSDSDMVS